MLAVLKAYAAPLLIISGVAFSTSPAGAETREFSFKFENAEERNGFYDGHPGYIKSVNPEAWSFFHVIVADQTKTNREGAIRLSDERWQQGWVICDAVLIRAKTWIFEGATFNATLQEDSAPDPGAHQLAYLDAQGTGEFGALKGQNSAKFSIKIVTRDDPALQQCMAPGPVWQCGASTPAGDRNCNGLQYGAVSGSPPYEGLWPCFGCDD